jgi:hypothetical protein
MRGNSIDYFRSRERAEREAVRNASCEDARWAHQQMAAAYARLIELEELKAAGAVAPDKVTTRSEALRARNDPSTAAALCPSATSPGRLFGASEIFRSIDRVNELENSD